MKRLALLLLALALAGCAASQRDRISDAAKTPLTDLNLLNDAIPPVLLTAQKNPYAPLPETSCDSVAVAVHELDEVLEPDVDAPKTGTDPTLIERGGQAVGNAAIGAFKGAAENVVPFRGWVRKLSGAERFSKKVSRAIAAGNTRRAFLKGVRTGLACTA